MVKIFLSDLDAGILKVWSSVVWPLVETCGQTFPMIGSIFTILVSCFFSTEMTESCALASFGRQFLSDSEFRDSVRSDYTATRQPVL